MKDIPGCAGELGGSASDIAAGELGEAVMMAENQPLDGGNIIYSLFALMEPVSGLNVALFAVG
jgi:hypothetical protein